MPRLSISDIGNTKIMANEVADVAADAAADHLGSYDEEVAKDKQIRDTQYKVCKRLSAIELHIREVWGSLAITSEDIIHAVTSRYFGLSLQALEKTMVAFKSLPNLQGIG